MSYTNLVYHIVLRTYRSTPSITEANERELYAYVYGYCNNHKAKLYRIDGMPDHVHLLVSIPPHVAVSEFVRGLKYAAGQWLKQSPHFPRFDGWGEGYAAFSYSTSQIPYVKQYIISQKEHHQRVTFADEYRQFIQEHGGTIEESRFLAD